MSRVMLVCVHAIIVVLRVSRAPAIDTGASSATPM